MSKQPQEARSAARQRDDRFILGVEALALAANLAVVIFTIVKHDAHGSALAAFVFGVLSMQTARHYGEMRGQRSKS